MCLARFLARTPKHNHPLWWGHKLRAVHACSAACLRLGAPGVSAAAVCGAPAFCKAALAPASVLMNPTPPTTAGDLLLGTTPMDMEVDVEDAMLADHEAAAEKTDTDFFNGDFFLNHVPVPFHARTWH